MESSGGRSRLHKALAPYEELLLVYGVVAVAAAVWLALREPLPSLPWLAFLGALSALSVHLNTADTDHPSGLAFSAEGVVVATSVLLFRTSSPLLGPLLIGMAAAFWRWPRNRHQWFAVPGNFGSNGLPALAAAAVVAALPVGAAPTALSLAFAALPAALAGGLCNYVMLVLYVRVHHHAPWREALTGLAPNAVAMYVPFLFGAFVGELSLRFGAVVVVLAAASFVMVQHVFASWRHRLASDRQTAEAVMAAVERKDPYTAGHSQRVGRFARYIGERLGYSPSTLVRLERHGLMHDVGKLAVPNHVLRKPGRLEDDERTLMLRHETAGAAILAGIPLLSSSATVASGRDDRKGLSGPIREPHIVHCADAFDAMTSTRAYRKAKTQEEAIDELQKCAHKEQPQFHAVAVDSLTAALAARGEIYGAGYETAQVVYDVAPPERALGGTLHDDDPPEDDEEVVEKKRTLRIPTLPTDLRWAAQYSVLALAAGLATAFVAPAATIAAAVAASSLVAAGELAQLRPVGQRPRALSLVPMLVTLATLRPAYAVGAIVAGVLAAAAVHPQRDVAIRALATAVTMGTYFALCALWPGADSVAAAITCLIGAALATVTVEAIAAHERLRFDLEHRLADLALVTCGPLAALGVAGTASGGGIGMGAFVILALPFALLAQGFYRDERAHEDLYASLHAIALAPEHAELVARGRAERVCRYALAIGRTLRLESRVLDQMEAAACFERVGECCLDDEAVLGRPHAALEIVEESGAILDSTQAFSVASRILHAHLNAPDGTATTDIDRAGQILRVAVAFENATRGEFDVATVPAVFATLRNDTNHPLDSNLCSVLQKIVAPGTIELDWAPPRTHALLTCMCVVPVEELTLPGDPLTCLVHGEQHVVERAYDRVCRKQRNTADVCSAVGELLEDRAHADEVQRELYIRLVADHAHIETLTAVARAAYETGAGWERSIAAWLHEAGASPATAADILSSAGTSGFEAFAAVRYAYSEDEIAHWHEPVAGGPPHVADVTVDVERTPRRDHVRSRARRRRERVDQAAG